MKIRTKLAFTAAMILLAGAVCIAKVHSLEVLWVDFDMKNIPEPKERASGYYDAFFREQVIEGTKQLLDVPRWIRIATGHPKESTNVNALDEVPSSSWYTNRHRFHRMSPEELRRGPNTTPPDLSSVVVTKAKTAGVTTGMMVKDASGQAYLIKFDGPNYPNLLSSAEIITTKILYAAGYNVPENYIAYLDPKTFSIGKDVQTTDEKTGRKRSLTLEDIQQMLQRAAVGSDGRYRVVASKIIGGKAKGPFSHVGIRGDDPNDLIPHENRRELRGLQVISSWLNNWDLKEGQSLDTYVEENGRKFLRHYLLDFGSSLGADDNPTEYYHGHEYGLDASSVAKEIFTLGIFESANEKRALIISPEVGNFTAVGFNPGAWKPTFPSVMLENMTDLDAFWATRVMLSFSESDLRNIVETAEYSQPTSMNYMVQTLLERRKMVARYWLNKVDGLSDFAIRPTAEGVALSFKDLMVDEQFLLSELTNYTYQVKGANYKSAKATVQRPEIRIDREMLSAAIEHPRPDGLIEISIWPSRRVSNPEPVRVYFDWSPNRDTFTVRRIARG
jgi:hypothetical protein